MKMFERLIFPLPRMLCAIYSKWSDLRKVFQVDTSVMSVNHNHYTRHEHSSCWMGLPSFPEVVEMITLGTVNRERRSGYLHLKVPPDEVRMSSCRKLVSQATRTKRTIPDCSKCSNHPSRMKTPSYHLTDRKKVEVSQLTNPSSR